MTNFVQFWWNSVSFCSTLNVAFTYAIAKCFWWWPFPDPMDRSFQAAESCLAQAEIDWGSGFLNMPLYMLFHNKYSPPIRTVRICCMSSLLSHSYLNYSVLLVCLASPDCYPGILQIKDFFPLSLIFQFPHLPVKTDQVWWQYCVIYCMPGISYI